MNKALCPYCGSEMKVEELLPFSGDCAYTCECVDFVAERNRYRKCPRRLLQKPLSLEEACDDKNLCVFLEIKDEPNIYVSLLRPDFGFDSCEINIFLEEEGTCYKLSTYGKFWRCWAAKPTQEEREAAEWNE